MKKIILLAIMAVLFISCNSNVDLDVKDNYTFTTTYTINCYPNIIGYPRTTIIVTTKNGITENDAKLVAASLTNATSEKSGVFKFTSTWECIYILTKNYVDPGDRVVN